MLYMYVGPVCFFLAICRSNAAVVKEKQVYRELVYEHGLFLVCTALGKTKKILAKVFIISCTRAASDVDKLHLCFGKMQCLTDEPYI